MQTLINIFAAIGALTCLCLVINLMIVRHTSRRVNADAPTLFTDPRQSLAFRNEGTVGTPARTGSRIVLLPPPTKEDRI